MTEIDPTRIHNLGVDNEHLVEPDDAPVPLTQRAAEIILSKGDGRTRPEDRHQALVQARALAAAGLLTDRAAGPLTSWVAQVDVTCPICEGSFTVRQGWGFCPACGTGIATIVDAAFRRILPAVETPPVDSNIGLPDSNIQNHSKPVKCPTCLGTTERIVACYGRCGNPTVHQHVDECRDCGGTGIQQVESE